MMSKEKRKHLFMSHATASEVITKEIIAILEKNSFKCWFAQRDVQVGEHYASELSRALTTAGAVILVLEEKANRSKHVLREITIAIERSIPVFIIQFGDFPLSEGLDYLLSGIQRIHGETNDIDNSTEDLIGQIYKAKILSELLNINKSVKERYIPTASPDSWGYASELPLPNWLKALFEDKK